MTACGVFASMTYDTHEHVDGVRIIFCRCATQLAGSYTHVVIIAMRAVLVALIIFSHVLSESLLALFADKDHLSGLCEWMRLCLCMAFGAVVPLFAARSSDGDLCIQDVLAERGLSMNVSNDARAIQIDRPLTTYLST